LGRNGFSVDSTGFSLVSPPHAPQTRRLTSLQWIRSFGVRLAAAAKDEASFDARKVLARYVSCLLPQFAFCRTRTVLLRAIGLRLGKGQPFSGRST
jgi:hypothetical protein